jgi:secondary thiamine-phosphate synthase enzyme
MEDDGLLMMSQHTTALGLRTPGPGFIEITNDVLFWVKETGIRRGLLTLQIRHTSASLLIQENADPDVRADLERFFRRLVPPGDPIFEHTVDGDDDMPAHVRAALTATSLSLPVENGRPTLGTWQGIYVWEHRAAPHRREVVAHLIGE